MQQRAEERTGREGGGAALLPFFSAEHPSGRPGEFPRSGRPTVRAVVPWCGRHRHLRRWIGVAARPRRCAWPPPSCRCHAPRRPKCRGTPRRPKRRSLARLAAANAPPPHCPPDEPASQEAILTLMEGRSIVPATGLRTVQIDDSEGAIAGCSRQRQGSAGCQGGRRQRCASGTRAAHRRARSRLSQARRAAKTIAEAIANEGVTVRGRWRGAPRRRSEQRRTVGAGAAHRQAFVAKVVNLLQAAAPPPRVRASRRSPRVRPCFRRGSPGCPGHRPRWSCAASSPPGRHEGGGGAGAEGGRRRERHGGQPHSACRATAGARQARMVSVDDGC